MIDEFEKMPEGDYRYVSFSGFLNVADLDKLGLSQAPLYTAYVHGVLYDKKEEKSTFWSAVSAPLSSFVYAYLKECLTSDFALSYYTKAKVQFYLKRSDTILMCFKDIALSKLVDYVFDKYLPSAHFNIYDKEDLKNLEEYCKTGNLFVEFADDNA